jgi:hypothetical protein
MNAEFLRLYGRPLQNALATLRMSGSDRQRRPQLRFVSCPLRQSAVSTFSPPSGALHVSLPLQPPEEQIAAARASESIQPNSGDDIQGKPARYQISKRDSVQLHASRGENGKPKDHRKERKLNRLERQHSPGAIAPGNGVWVRDFRFRHEQRFRLFIAQRTS